MMHPPGLLDGFTVAELLRRHPATARTQVVMLSAHGGLSVQARGVECGVQTCLLKTAGIEQILVSVQEALSLTACKI